MNNSEIKYFIQPVVKTTVKTIEKFSISLSNLILFTSVDILVCYYDVNDNFIDMTTLTLDGDDYSAWYDDDNYLITWVKTKLSLESII